MGLRPTPTATHTCPRAGGASSLPDALLHLFAPALVQPRPARTGGKRFFTRRKKTTYHPRGIMRRTCLSVPAKARGWHQASGRSPTPPPSQSLAPPSTPRAAPKQTSSSCAPGGTPCCSPPRRLALSSTCRNPGDKFLMAQAIWLGGHSDSMVCLREACPRVTTLAPRTLTSPSLCLAGFGADGVPLNRIWAFMTAHVRPAR